MINILKKENCVACGACLNVCHNQCIKMESDDEGFLYPVVNTDNCVNCYQCEKVCPMASFQFNLSSNEYPKTYAVVNKDSQVLLKSSSGGVFHKLASSVINAGGVVVGAAFTSTYDVGHIIIDKLQDIELIQSSKYVQSDIGIILKQIKDILLEGKYVLYSGTPCQIAGLKKFLKKDYENLITVDIICHGVPSPGVWKRYLDKIVEKKVIKHINFRSKRNIGAYGLEVVFANGENFFQSVLDNTYMKGFIDNLYLRPSCYCCKFKEKNRIGDITLGDLWRADKILTNVGEHEYISLVVVNSQKGDNAFELTRNSCYIESCNYENAIKYNKSIIESSKYNQKRTEFFEKFISNDIGILELLELYTRENRVRQIVSSSKRIIKKIIRWRIN